VILYKYLSDDRIGVLRDRMIRFTQPGDFNDPFEFRPTLQQIANTPEVSGFVEENFDSILEIELQKYGALLPSLGVAQARELLLPLKSQLSTLFQMLEPGLIEKIQPELGRLLDQKIGVLCLSEVSDSSLMWGHYGSNHKGYVIGFDSEHAFFNRRRTPSDEFGFLRKVSYAKERPQVSLSDTNSHTWFQTKSDDWAYQREWRIVKVLDQASARRDRDPFPTYLFEFPREAVLEIIVGLRSEDSFEKEVEQPFFCKLISAGGVGSRSQASMVR
jgi:hypothetical protein